MKWNSQSKWKVDILFIGRWIQLLQLNTAQRLSEKPCPKRPPMAIRRRTRKLVNQKRQFLCHWMCRYRRSGGRDDVCQNTWRALAGDLLGLDVLRHYVYVCLCYLWWTHQPCISRGLQPVCFKKYLWEHRILPDDHSRCNCER